MARNETVSIEQPFSDWPRLDVADGGRAMRMSGRYRAPSWWWSWGFGITLIVLIPPVLMPVSCSLVADLSYGGRTNQVPDGVLLNIVIAWVIGWFALVVLGEIFGPRRQLDVKVTPEVFVINGKSYARGEGLNQFAIEEHEKAHNEEMSARRGQAGGRFFRDAVQVVMRYGERRVPIAAFGRKDVRKAEALLVRLQMLNENIEQMLGMAAQGDDAAAPGARDDFGPARPIR